MNAVPPPEDAVLDLAAMAAYAVHHNLTGEAAARSWAAAAQNERERFREIAEAVLTTASLPAASARDGR